MTGDTTGRQDDATGRATPDATGARVVSITEAAQVLGLSVRTIQRRLDSGALQAIEVEGARRVQLPKARATGDATEDDRGRDKGNATGRQVARQDATEMATAQVLAAPNAGTREEELREEVKFLRGVIEQQQRDAAELRAALREALKMSQRALPEPAAPSPPEVRAPTSAQQVLAHDPQPSGPAPSAGTSEDSQQPRPGETPQTIRPQRQEPRGFRGWLLRALRGPE